METCPQYLLLEESVYDDPDFTEAAKFVCAPPIRTVADQEALWLALGDGEIQTVSTDHCSFTTAQKRAGRYDFTKIPGGLPGVETRGVLLYNRRRGGRTHHRGGPVPRPERKSGQAIWVLARKGVIAPGSDADIVVYDPAADSVITAADQVQNVDYNPYEGFQTRGYTYIYFAQVYLRGHLAVDRGRVLAENRGAFIPRGPCSL